MRLTEKGFDSTRSINLDGVGWRKEREIRKSSGKRAKHRSAFLRSFEEPALIRAHTRTRTSVQAGTRVTCIRGIVIMISWPVSRQSSNISRDASS